MNNFERLFTYSSPNPEDRASKDALKVGFVGNPNSGKTTLFNAYTGAKLKTANYPGVTVEAKCGSTTFLNCDIELIDLPGIYSLTSYTQEEKIARQHILSGAADVIVDVVDATSLERSLYLTVQLLELKVPVVVALNMMDLAQKRGLEIDIHRLSEVLGCPVIPISASKRDGLTSLLHACLHHQGHIQDPLLHFHASEDGMQKKHAENVLVYSISQERELDLLQEALTTHYPKIKNPRWHAIKLLEGDEEYLAEYNKVAPPQTFLEDELISERYDFISKVIRECTFDIKGARKRSDAADAILTNKFFAIPIFLIVLAAVFVLTFLLGNFVKDLFDQWLSVINVSVSSALTEAHIAAPLISLVSDGIITGVGTVLTFLPNIVILFILLGFLEDCGYMSRIAYVMDDIMGHLGLSGKAFIPMILGFGCTVPAIMSSRTLENSRDQKKVMLILPFMSCSARLPIYILFAGMFFPNAAAAVAFSLYLLGILVALVVLKILTLIHKESASPLLIELPDYKMPSFHTIWVFVTEKTKDYVLRAGTVIFAASVILWLLLHLGPAGFVANDLSHSFASVIGHAIAPLLAPFGANDWRLAVALLAGISAKEVVVSSVSVLFNANVAQTGTQALAQGLAAIGFGPQNALAFMVFSLLYVPCIATIAVLHQESRSAKFALLTALLQLVIAWVLATVVYQLACLI